MDYDELLEWSIAFPKDVDATAASVRLVRRTDGTWHDVPATSGQLMKAELNGLWIDPGVSPMLPGTYAVIITGTSLGPIGYQIVLDQCTEVPVHPVQSSQHTRDNRRVSAFA